MKVQIQEALGMYLYPQAVNDERNNSPPFFY